MVRGLAIRRFFILLDLALAAAAVAMGGILVMRFLHPVQAALPQEERSEPPADAGGMRLPEVGPLASYDVITKYGLFGDAGRFDPSKAPPPPPVQAVQEDLPDTDLNLRLMGTIALSKDDLFASAFIQDLDRRGNPESFLLGEEVVDKVVLAEVHKRQVILLNKRKTPPVQERLRMDDGESFASAPKVKPPSSTSTRSTQRVQLSKAEITDELVNNYSELLKIKPVIKRDARGNVTGVTAANIGRYPLAKKLGLQDGDILQTVNNERIDSQAKIMELIQKHQNASSFRIGILRNGKPRIITYNLR